MGVTSPTKYISVCSPNFIPLPAIQHKIIIYDTKEIEIKTKNTKQEYEKISTYIDEYLQHIPLGKTNQIYFSKLSSKWIIIDVIIDNSHICYENRILFLSSIPPIFGPNGRPILETITNKTYENKKNIIYRDIKESGPIFTKYILDASAAPRAIVGEILINLKKYLLVADFLFVNTNTYCISAIAKYANISKIRSNEELSVKFIKPIDELGKYTIYNKALIYNCIISGNKFKVPFLQITSLSSEQQLCPIIDKSNELSEKNKHILQSLPAWALAAELELRHITINSFNTDSNYLQYILKETKKKPQHQNMLYNNLNPEDFILTDNSSSYQRIKFKKLCINILKTQSFDRNLSEKLLKILTKSKPTEKDIILYKQAYNHLIEQQ